jgi:serine/threonine protein kinase
VTPLIVGAQLDRYRIDELVARGGMASIFRATDLRSGERVAIKVPHPEMECDPLLFDRFQREQAIGRRLHHPGVMKVLPNDNPSRVYMVMEWVEGRLLRHLLGVQEPLSRERAIRIAVRICAALEYMHGQGVVHRDLKPENIMVDAHDQVKLIDFGLANATGARRLTFGKLTQLMGTPDYISPEQVKGKRGDGRCDLYALGVILYEMLTRKLPFRGENPFAVMNDRLVSNPVPPREMDPMISAALQETIYRALERNPENRYQSAAEFARDLEYPEQVGCADRAELKDWSWRREPLPRKIAFYSMLAAIPAVIFGLLLYVAKR